MAANPPLATPAAPGAGEDARLARARALARLLDSAFRVPGTSFTVGLDPLIGLLPAGGDLVGALLSGYIVVTGVRLGAPSAVVARMLGNIAIDTAVGSIPVLGDLFDAGWRSNQRNLALLERYLAAPDATAKRSRFGVVLGLLLVVAVAVGALALGFLAIRALMRAAR